MKNWDNLQQMPLKNSLINHPGLEINTSRQIASCTDLTSNQIEPEIYAL
jgi:hypothetical protein